MKILTALLSNTVLIATICSWIAGQGSKVLLLALRGKLTKERLTGGGGMPSGHTATVSGLATSIAMVEGLNSSVFALSLFFAILAVYDALGVRYVTGEQGRVLNRMQKDEQKKLLAEGKENEAPELIKFPESMGHTLPEVIVGMILGIIVSAAVTALLR